MATPSTFYMTSNGHLVISNLAADNGIAEISGTTMTSAATIGMDKLGSDVISAIQAGGGGGGGAATPEETASEACTSSIINWPNTWNTKSTNNGIG